jgi:enamine deaminase RidA (YjgF/YER057c/UK114 family)
MSESQRAVSTSPDGPTGSRLRALGITLPPVVTPSPLFVPALAHSGTVTTSGQVAVNAGELVASGTVGVDVDLETGCACARQCLLNALAAVEAAIGDLDLLQTVTRMTVYVASGPDFHDQPKVADAASRLLLEILGDVGTHPRSAVGVAALPRRTPVEIELSATYRAEV